MHSFVLDDTQHCYTCTICGLHVLASEFELFKGDIKLSLPCIDHNPQDDMCADCEGTGVYLENRLEGVKGVKCETCNGKGRM